MSYHFNVMTDEYIPIESFVEPTPEMIKAGVEAYRPYWADLADGFNVKDRMVRDVWTAMVGEARRLIEHRTHPRER